MFSFYTNAILPVLNALFIALDWIFGWSLLFGALAALVIVGLLTGLFVNLIQKFLSNQNLLGRSKADLEKIKELRAAARQSNDAEAIARLNSLAGRISGRYAWGSFKPALWSIPPLCVLAMWAGSRISFEPVRPGNEIAVVAHFEDGASGFAHLIPNDSLAPVGPAIAAVEIPKSPAPAKSVDAVPAQNVAYKDAPPSEPEPASSAAGPQARWTVKATKEGTHPLIIRYQNQLFEIPVPVAAKGGRPPEPATVFALETPGRDGLLAVEFKLSDSVAPAWWNLKQQWMGVYLIAALISGLALRRVLGVN